MGKIRLKLSNKFVTILLMTITHRSQSQTGTQRDAWIEINLSALERNFRKLSDLIKTNIMAVVKADAYGHGACAIAPVLQSLGIHSFGVATVDEGLALRNAKIKVPVLILGATPSWAYDSCCENNLTITIYSIEQLDQLTNFAQKIKSRLTVQLKIDTGMNRLGVAYDDASNIIERILKSDFLKLEGVFSHLSDPKSREFSLLQKNRFDSVIQKFQNQDFIKHIAQTHAAIDYPEYRYDLVRVGIALYGGGYDFLEPLISLKARITEIHKIKKGDPVSYGRTWSAEKDTVIATIPVGYADGVSRGLSSKIGAYYDHALVKQVGTITMDQMMFDISEVTSPKVSDVLTLLGEKIKINDWAKILNTIDYELLCKLKIRLPRIYTRD